MSIKEIMPLLARHEGKWKGVYSYLNSNFEVVDKHDAVLDCTFPTEVPSTGEFPYHQTNTYTWADGRQEVHVFPGKLRESDKRLIFDTDRIYGETWEADEKIVMLKFSRRDIPDVIIYEMIHLDESGKKRSRIWNYLKNGVSVRYNLIVEEKVE